MSIFSRKKQNSDTDNAIEESNANLDNYNDHDFQVGELGELEEKTQKQVDENQIASSEDADDMPSANMNDREGGSKKKLQLAIISMVGLLLVLIGIGTAVARYQDSKEAKRIEEAEQTAQDQKQLATGNVDISDEQAAMEMNRFNDIPPPAGALEDPLAAPFGSSDELAAVPPSYQSQPYVEPVTPTARYGNDAPSTSYASPAAIPDASIGGSLFGGGNSFNDDPQPVQPMPQVEYQAPMPKGADSNVMVDVNSLRTAQAQVAGNKSNSKVGGNLNPTVLDSTSANRRASKALTLLRGTSIPCVLQTKIDSTYQGFTICQTSKDVYSSDGKTLLVERGSKVFGEQNVELNQGQARVAILWTRVETPKGVSVNIDSPATGSLGEMGVGAKVNNHFWKRFGGAIMLSIVQDAISAGSSRLEGKDNNSGNNNTSIQNTERATESMAEKALENTINIPPTAIIKQGTLINIMVVRDVDFSSVYKVKRR